MLDHAIGSHHRRHLARDAACRDKLLQVTGRSAAPAQVELHAVAHDAAVAAQIEEGILGRMHADPGADFSRTFPDWP